MSLHGMKGLQYNERLKPLGLIRLERRRVRSDLIDTFKIMNEKYDFDCNLFFSLMRVDEEDMIRNCSRKD